MHEGMHEGMIMRSTHILAGALFGSLSILADGGTDDGGTLTGAS